MKQRILVVEDDCALLETLTDRLESDGYIVRGSTNGDAAYEEALAGDFDLIILDIMLPGRNGLDVCSGLRRRRVDTPILMLTARGGVTDRVVGLRLGADDYLPKPFHMSELVARVDALIRRASKPRIVPAAPVHVGALEIDIRSGQVSRGVSGWCSLPGNGTF